MLKNVALRSDGLLSLAPRAQELFDTQSPYLWALAVDSKGTLYAGGGATAKLFAIPPGGKGRLVADLDSLEIHALAVDSRDRVYAATSPDGKIYRITGNAKPEVFYDPKAKYIWAMAFDSKGDLLVATGDQGEIHRVAPDGKGKVFFKSDETHVRSLAIDAKGDIVAGTDPRGLVLRVNAAGEGFVLYQMPKREVTAVAVARDGSIYAAAVGTKPTSTPPPAQPSSTAPPASANVAGSGAAQPAGAARPTAASASHVGTRSERRQRCVSHRSQRESAPRLDAQSGRRVRDRVRRRGPRDPRGREQGQRLSRGIADPLHHAADTSRDADHGISGRARRPPVRRHRQCRQSLRDRAGSGEGRQHRERRLRRGQLYRLGAD